MKFTVTIITFNEAANIREVCESVAWADEILVVDSESVDGTADVARSCGARVIVRAWPGFAEQKQFAVDAATHDWILSVDADERVTAELRESIARVRGASAPAADGYRMARRSYYMNRWIKGGGWYPDYQLRFFHRSQGRWEGMFVHESVKMREGAWVAALDGDLLHYSVRSAAEHHRMIGERYAPLAARQMLAKGVRTSPIKVALAAPLAFFRSFFLKGGFRDGLAGLCIARFAAHHAFLKHLLCWEMQQQQTPTDDSTL